MMRNNKLIRQILLVIACMLLLVGYKEEYNVEHVELGGMVSIAHRGASSYAPENTYAAFEKGL